MSSLDSIVPLQAGASEMIILHLWTALPQCCISVLNLMLLIKTESGIKAYKLYLLVSGRHILLTYMCHIWFRPSQERPQL